MKKVLPYQLTVWFGAAVIILVYVVPVNIDLVVRSIAAYAVYVIFEEVFVPNIERAKQVEDEYDSLWVGAFPELPESKEEGK